MPQTRITQGVESADHAEIQSIFAARSARSYAAEQRRLRTEDDARSDSPITQSIGRALDALRWHETHAGSR